MTETMAAFQPEDPDFEARLRASFRRQKNRGRTLTTAGGAWE